MANSLRGKSKNTWSKKMRALSESGVTIVCAVSPYLGWEVEFSPRYECDREPWKLKGYPSIHRYNGREVHPMDETEVTQG